VAKVVNVLMDNLDNALMDNALMDNALMDNALMDNALMDNALMDNALMDNRGNVRKTHKVKDAGYHHCRFCKRLTQTMMVKFPVTK
jgi:hypothetical protein